MNPKKGEFDHRGTGTEKTPFFQLAFLCVSVSLWWILTSDDFEVAAQWFQEE